MRGSSFGRGSMSRRCWEVNVFLGEEGLWVILGGVRGDFTRKIKKKAVTDVVFGTSVLTGRMGFGTSNKIALCCNNRFRFAGDAFLARGCRT